MKKILKNDWYLFFIFLFVELFLIISDFGIIEYGKISVVVLHIPIIIATIILGLGKGILLSIVFGINSLVMAINYSPSELNSVFQNPIISVVTRLMIPVVAWLFWKGVNNIANDGTLSSTFIRSGFTAILGTLSNTIFVTLALVILVPDKVGIDANFSVSSVVITNIIAKNVLFEILLAVVVTCIFVPIIEKNRRDDDIDINMYPVDRSFNKWLLLFFTIGFFLVLLFFYSMQTNHDRNNASKLLNQKYDDIIVMINSDTAFVDDVNYSVGERGSLVIIDKNNIIYAKDDLLVGKNIDDILKISKNFSRSVYLAEFEGKSGMVLLKEIDKYTIVMFMPDIEVYAKRDAFATILLSVLLVLFVCMYISVSKLIEINVVHKIQLVNEDLTEIKNGNLNKNVKVSGNLEFTELSNGINSTVKSLKKTTDEIIERINKEMEFARIIQTSSLPKFLPQTSHMYEIDIYAKMIPAKAVGGDFYDYYMLDDDHLAFLIADVSGKGISAAIFMMKAKTLIKSYNEKGLAIGKVIESANNELCQNNDASMFVTCWMAILDLNTYTLDFVNAGHNPPLVRTKENEYKYLSTKSNFVLGVMEDLDYEVCTYKVEHGTDIFLYTDGITEAINNDEELYNEERLLLLLKKIEDEKAEQICDMVFDNVSDFVGDAPQFDDMTALCLKIL